MFFGRKLAKLDKKDDERITAYFEEFSAMCRRVCNQSTPEDIETKRGSVSSNSRFACFTCKEYYILYSIQVFTCAPELEQLSRSFANLMNFNLELDRIMSGDTRTAFVTVERMEPFSQPHLFFGCKFLFKIKCYKLQDTS